jgi:hypothetical protein
MTPKEKAKELFDKCELSCAGVISNDEDWEALAKLCALIAVDEVLKSQKNIYGVNNKATKFYLEVKHELEKL